MSGAVGTYFLSIAASAMLLSLVQLLMPKGAVREISLFVGGLLVVFVILSPVADFDYNAAARKIMRFRPETEQIRTDTAAINRELMASIIKENCETYILDKAKGLGIELEAEVILNREGDYPYPESVLLKGKADPQQQMLVMEFISKDLGIPAHRQEWKSD